MLKRIISLLLVFALVFSVFPPVPVFAAETSDEMEAPASEDRTGLIQDTTTVTATLDTDENCTASEDEPISILEMENLEDEPWFDHLDLGMALMIVEEEVPMETVPVPEEEEPEAPHPTEPEAPIPTEPEERIPFTVLLIQETLPWGLRSNTNLLAKLLSEGYIDDYTVTTMTAAANLNLSEYSMIMIPSVQGSSTYSTYASYVQDQVEAYVANGGILYFSVCTQSAEPDMPGSVKSDHATSRNNVVADSDHPIVTGELSDGTVLSNSMLSGNYCSHNVIVESTLPENSNVILRSSTDNAPTLVEYPYGSGYVVASGLTWEFYYIGQNSGSGGFSINSYDDVILYAISQNRYDDSTLPVTNLHTESVGSRSVSLKWNPARNQNVTFYRVFRNGCLVAEVDACAFTDGDLDPSTSYTYQVVGYTAGNLAMDPAELIVVTRELPQVLDIYTDNGNEVGGAEGTLYACVNAGAALAGAEGEFMIIDHASEETIGDYVVDYTITNNGVVYQTEWDVADLESGVYTIAFRLVDADGESSTYSEEITVNNKAPSPIVALTVQGDVDAIYLSWSLAAEYNVNTYRIYRRVSGEESWTLLKEKSGDRNDTAYTDTAVEPDVVYEYVVTAVSRYGIESAQCDPVPGTLVTDKEPPVVTSLSPARNSLLRGTVQVSAAASDNDVVAGMALYYKQGENDPVLFASGSGASITAQLDTTLLADGKVDIYAIATDAAGNKSAGTPVYTSTVDNTAPASVTNLTYTSSATVITLSWSYVQDDDFNRFVVETLGANGTWSVAATSSKTLGVNLTGLKPGASYTYRVSVVDNAGNVSAFSEELTAVTQSDTTAPVVSAINPGAGYRSQDFQVNFTMKDDYAVAGVEIQISRNRLNWETVAVETFADPAATKTYTYTVRVASYPEDGSLYVRAIPVDTADNRGLDSTDAPFVEYVLDRTAPNMPTGVSAVASGNSIYVLWSNDPAKETVSYSVLRSATKDGNYTVIASGLTSISYYDRTAQADVVYWYQVQGVDAAGNISQSSTPASASWSHTSDVEKPQVLSIGPADGSKLGGSTTSISVLAQDDRILSHIEAVFTNKTQGTSQTLAASGNGSYYLSASLQPDSSDWKSGDRIQVSVVAYDGNGNASDAMTVSYVMDLTAPAVKNLNAALDGSVVTLTWKAGSNSDDLNGYYVYRSTESGWTRIGTRGARADGSYTFTDTLSANGTYTYRVTAVDLLGNQADYNSNTITYAKPREELLIADFVTDRQQQENVEYLFDGSVSYCEEGYIASYLFDFGDGTTSSQPKAIHAYKETGTYTVTLTITDDAGNTASASTTVEVKERASLGVLSVTVVNDNGVPVGNTPVYFDMESDNTIIKYTDANGKVSFTSNAGTYTVGAYKDGYLPVTKKVVLAGSSTRAVELVMVEQPIVTGEFEINRMTLEEIVAAGIDVTDPANQHCVSVTVQLSYGEQSVDMDFVRNDYGDIVFGENTTVIGDRQFIALTTTKGNWHYGGGVGPGGGGGGSSIPDEPDVVVILEIPVGASFLKEFFDVKLHIMNQATEEFKLVDNVIQLNVPDGMTFMSESKNADIETLNTLRGQQTWSLSWIIRGDKEGIYNLSADYSGVLDGFNADVRATFQSPDIRVYGTSAIHVVINLNKTIRYQTYYLDVGIKNMTDIDLYLPSVGIAESVVRALYPNKPEEEDTEDYLGASTVGIWIENEYGFQEAVKEEPDVLSSGESLHHRYAIHQIDSDDKVLQLNGIILSALKNIGIEQIEVNVNTFNLYPDSGEDAERIMKAAEGPARAEYRYLTTPTNFMYYNVGYYDENSILYQIGSTGKDMLDVVLAFDFDCFTNNTNRSFFRAIVAELMADEVLADYVSAQMSKDYAEATKKVLTGVANTLKMMGNDVEDVDNFFTELMADSSTMNGLAVMLQDEGCSTDFTQRLGRLIAAGSLNVSYEAAMEILQNSALGDILNLSLMEKLGDVGDVFDFGSKLANGWADAVDAANAMLTLKYAEEESTYFLRTMMKQIESSGNGDNWMYDEAKEMLKELQDANKDQKDTMIRVLNRNVGQAILETGVEKASEVVAKETAKYLVNTFGVSASALSSVATVYKILQVVYKLADYALNLSDYYDRSDQMIAMMTLNAIFTGALDDAKTAVDKVHALKYIIKINLAGERVFTEYVKADKDRAEHFEEVNGYDADAYQSYIYKSIQSARDSLYYCVMDESELPAAPESLTFDYLNERTVETFDSTYEYSLNGGETWTTCGDMIGAADHIYVSGKTISQSLRVRLRATESNRAGANATLVLGAMPKHRYATAAGEAGNTCFVWGLTANTTYQVMKSNVANPENPDWSASVRLTTNSDGELSGKVPGEGSYLLYRMPATADSFPSEIHSILLSRDLKVQITASVQGNGTVLRGDKAFSSCIVDNGDTVTLSVSFDETTTEFKGWYVGDTLYSNKQTLQIEAVQDLDLVAVFAELPTYTFTVTAGEGGTVTGGGTFYKGQSATARAFASAGYTFSHWVDGEGKAVSVNSTRTVTLMENVKLHAVFEELPKARVFVSLSVQQIEGMELPTATVTMAGNTYTVTAAEPLSETSGAVMQGETITLTANSTKDAKFVHWQTDKGTVVSEKATFTATAAEYTSYVAVYRVEGQSVTFTDMKGNIISSRQYPASAAAEDIELASAPAMNGYNFVGWKVGNGNTIYGVATSAQITTLQKAILAEISKGSDVILKAQYEAIPERYTVTVINGTGSGTYNASTALTIKANAAPAGFYFAGWYEDDVLISSNASYSFYVTANRTLEARYAEKPVEAVGTTRIETVTCDSSAKKLSFVSVSSVPQGCTIQKAGVIATSDASVGESDNFTASNAAYVRYGTTDKLNYKYTWSKSKVTADQTWYVRAYLVYADTNGNVHTVYSDVVAATLTGVVD